jgi:hypothetical protein
MKKDKNNKLIDFICNNITPFSSFDKGGESLVLLPQTPLSPFNPQTTTSEI